MIKKFFLEIRSFFKDILLFGSYSHKVPVSIIFNKLPYQNLRISIDFFFNAKISKKLY